MSDLKLILQNKLKEDRPNLSDSSLRTYVSILTNLNKKLNGKNTIDWFKKEHNQIFDYLEEKNDQTKKITLSSFFT